MGQGLNVVLVALPDKLLDAYYAELTAKYPQLQFIKVPADLSKPDGLVIRNVPNDAYLGNSFEWLLETG